MYQNFNKTETFNEHDLVYLTKVTNGTMLDYVIIGEVTTAEKNYMVVYIIDKNENFYLMFNFGRLIAERFSIYRAYSSMQEATSAMDYYIETNKIKETINKMLEKATDKQLEAIYSYLVAEGETNEERNC